MLNDNKSQLRESFHKLKLLHFPHTLFILCILNKVASVSAQFVPSTVYQITLFPINNSPVWHNKMGQGSAFSLLLRKNNEQRCREGEFSHEEYKVKKKKKTGSVRLASLGGYVHRRGSLRSLWQSHRGLKVPDAALELFRWYRNVIHAVSINTGFISMLLFREHRGQVLPHYVTHLLCLDGVDLCLFSVNFCQSILILDVYYVLFSKQNAPEISSCGGKWFKKENT